MIFIFDTNIIIDEYSLNTIEYKTFIRFCKKYGHPLLIPHIALLEAERVYSDRIRKYNADIARLLEFGEDSLAGRGILSDSSVDVDSLRHIFSYNLIGQGKTFDVRLIYNFPEHRETAIKRVLEGKSPIKAEGENARDALIWLSILKEIEGKSDTVVFISSDGNFAQKRGRVKSNDLHHDLVEDLSKIGFDLSKFKFYNSLTNFLESISTELTIIENRLIKLKSEIEFINEELSVVGSLEYNKERIIRDTQHNMRGVGYSLMNDPEYPDPSLNPRLIEASRAVSEYINSLPAYPALGTVNRLMNIASEKHKEVEELEEEFNQVAVNNSDK